MSYPQNSNENGQLPGQDVDPDIAPEKNPADGDERDRRKEDEEADHLLHGKDLPDPPIEP